MMVINKLLTFYSPMDLLIPVLLFSLVSSPLFVGALHAPINTTRTFTAQPPPSFQKQANLGVKSAKVFSFSGNSNAGVAPPLPPQPKAKPWDLRNSYQIPQQGIFPPVQQRKPNVPPLFQRNNQPNQLMPQTFNRNQLLRAGSSGFPAKQQPFIVTTPVPTPSPDALGGSQVRFNFKAAKARQAQLARMRTTSPKPSPTPKNNINTSSFKRFDRFNRFKKPRNKQKFKKPTTPKPEKKYVSGNGVQYTDLSKIAKDGSYMGNQDPLYVYSTTTAPPPTYPPTQPPYRQPYRNNYQNNYYQTTTYGYQYYQTTNNYNYDPYYQGQYQNNNAPYQGNNQQYQGPNNQQYQGNYQGYATTTPYYQDQGYQNQGQYNQGYQNQEGYQYTTPPYYPPAQPNNQVYQNNYGPPAGPQQGGNYPQNSYSGNQTYSNYNYPGQDLNAQYQPQPQGQVQNTQYQPPQANQGPPSNQGTNAQYQPPPGNQSPNAPYQPPPGNQGPNTQYNPPPGNQVPNAQYQPPPANQVPNAQYQSPPANQVPNSQYQPPSANLAPNTPYQPPPPANQGPNAQYQPPPGNQGPPMNQGPNNQYAPPSGIQGPNAQSLPPTGIQPPINQGPPVNPGANGQYQPPPGSQGVNAQYQPPLGAQGPNTQYRPPAGGQGPPPVQGQGYQPAQPAQSYPPQGNPPYQANLQQGSQQPQNISSNAPYQYQPGQGYNDNYIPPKSGGAVPSPEQSWVRIDNIMTTVKPPSNERWVQVGSIKPTWTTQSTITVNQNKKVQDTTTRAPPDVAGWNDPAPNPNDINLEIIGDTLIESPIEITKSLDINITSETSANTGSDKPLRGDIQIGNSRDQISINVKDKLVTTKTKETKNKVLQSDASNKSKINQDTVKKSAIKTDKLVPEKAVKDNVTTEGKSNVSSSESKAKLKTDKNVSKDASKPKTTTTSTTSTSTTTTPKPTTTTTTTPKPTTTTPKPTTTTPKPTTTTPKPTTTTPKPTTTTPKPTTTTPKPTTTTPKPTTTTPKPTTTTTPKPTTKKPTTTTTTTKAPSTTTKRPKVSSMPYKIENKASTQQIMETKPHVSVDVNEKITKQSSTSFKIETSRMPNSENPTNRILAGKESVSKTDILGHTKTMNSKTLMKSKINNSKYKNNITLKNLKITTSTDSKKLKNNLLSPPEKRETLDLNDKQTKEDKPNKSSRNKNRLSRLSTSNINNVSNTSYKLEMKSLNYENKTKMKTSGLKVDNTVSSDITRKINDNQETSKPLTRDKNVVSMDAELVRSFVKLIEHFTALTQPVLSARHQTTNIIGHQNISNTSSDIGKIGKTKIESFDKPTILKKQKVSTKTKDTVKESRRLPPSEFIKELQSGPRTTPTNIQIIRLSKIEREAQKNYAQRLEKSRMNKLRKQYQRDFENKLNNVKQDQLNIDSSVLLATQFDLSKEPRIETKGAIEKLQLNVKSSSLPESLENIMPLPEISTPPPVPLDLDLLNTQFDNSGKSQHNNLVYPMQAFETQVALHLPSTTPDMFVAFDETSLLRSNDIFQVKKSPITVEDRFLLNKNDRFDFNSNLQPAFQHVDTTRTETIFTIDGKPLRTKTKTKHSFNSKPIDPRKINKFLHDKRVMEASRQFVQAEKRFATIHNSNTRETNEVNGLQQNILATLPPTFEKASNNFLTNARHVPLKRSQQQSLSIREKQRTYDVPRGNFHVDTQSQNIKLPHELKINNGRERIEMPDKVSIERREFKSTNIPHNLFQRQQPKEIQPLNPERRQNTNSPPVLNIFQGNGNGQNPQPISFNTFNSEQVIPDVQRGLLYRVNNEVQHLGEKMNVRELMSPVQTHTETKTFNTHLNNFDNQEQTTTFSEPDLFEYLQSGFGPSVAQSNIGDLPYLDPPQNADPLMLRSDLKQNVNSGAVRKDKKTTIVFNTAPDRVHIEQQNTDGYTIEPQVNDYALYDNIDKMYEGNFVRQKENVLAEKNYRKKNIINKLITKSTPEPRNKAWSSTKTSSSDTHFMEKDNKVSNKITSNRQNTKIFENVRRSKNIMGNKKGSQLVPPNTQTSQKINNRFVVGITNEKANKGQMLTSEYVEQSSNVTKNQALNDRTSTQQSDKNSRRKIIIKHDIRPVILRKTLVKKIKYVKRKDNVQNQMEYITQTPEITTTTKSPTIKRAEIKLPSVTKSPLEIIEEAKKPTTSLLKKFQQMKYLINLIEVAENEKLKKNNGTAINKVISEKKVKHTALSNEKGLTKNISMDQEKSKFRTNVIETRGKKTDILTQKSINFNESIRKEEINAKGLQATTATDYKQQPQNETTVASKSVLKGLQTNVGMKNNTMSDKVFSKKEKYKIKPYTLSTPAFGTSRETRTYLSNQKSIPIFQLPRKTKLKIKKPQSQTTIKVNEQTQKSKQHIRKSSDSKNATLIDNNLIKTSNTSKENKKIQTKQVSFTKINNMKGTNTTSKEKQHKEAKKISLTKINNMKKTSNTSNENKRIQSKQVSFTTIINMKGTNNNSKEKKNKEAKNVSLTKINNMKRTSDTSKHKKTQTKQDSLTKRRIIKESNTKLLQSRKPQNIIDKNLKDANKEGIQEIRRKQHKTKHWITSTPKLDKSGRISGKLEKTKVFSMKQKTVKKINESDFKMSRNVKSNILPKISAKLKTKAKNSIVSSKGRKQPITAGNTRSQNNTLASKTVIVERNIANKTKPLNPLNVSKQVSIKTLKTRKSNSPNKKTTTAQLIRKMGLTFSKTNRPKEALKGEKKASVHNIKPTKARHQNNKTVLVSKGKVEVNSKSRIFLKPKLKNEQNSKILNKIDSTISMKTTSNRTEIKSDEKQATPFLNKITRQTIISPFPTNNFSVRKMKIKDSMISFSPVLKTISIKSNKINSVKKSNHPKTNIENKIKGSVNVSQYKNRHRMIKTPSSSPLPNKTIKVQNAIVKTQKYQSSARRSQRNETVIMTSNSQKDKMATKFRRTGPIRNLTAEENQLLLTQNNSLMNSVEPSNRHILVKILQFLYSNSSDPTSLETIKQEILSTTSKDQQIIIFDILAAYLGGTPPDNSYLVAKNNQSQVQTSAQRGVYVQQKPVLKDSHRYGPPRQDYRGPQYNVKAAAVDPHRMNNIGTTVFPTDLTTLPIYPTTKSFWDSLFSFTPTTPFPGNKPGSCPTAFALMFDCHNVCSHDSHCYGRQKCCHGGRGTGCCARPETMDVGFNNLLMPYMMAEGQGQGQGGQNNRFFGEILKKK